MVPARNLQLLRDAHGTAPFAPRDVAAGAVDAVTAPKQPPPSRHMAQEPINQEPPKPPPTQERQEHHHLQGPPQEERRWEALALPPPQQQQLQHAGTSGSSSGGSSSNGGARGGHSRDWLRLGLGPASPGAASEADLFAADRGTTRPRQEMLPGMEMPPGAFLRPAIPGIPQASIQIPVHRAGPPWLPPWSPTAVRAQQPPLLLPFAHRAFYAPASAAAGASGLDTIRVVLPPPAAAGVWFVLQAAAAPHQEGAVLASDSKKLLTDQGRRVTVRLLMKYLVNKLGLEDESEVEITCRGRPLLPFMTLQLVRDSMWCQRDAVSPSVAPDLSTANHIMVLQYARRP